MLFQILDDKKDCTGIYSSGGVSYGPLPLDLQKTWGYSHRLRDINTNIEYASIYCGGRTIEEVCPDSLKSEFERVRDKIKAFYRSFSIAKVSMDENCFFELLPERYLMEFYDIKNKITEHVFENYEKPENHDFLRDVRLVVEDIKNQKLNIDTKLLSDLSDNPVARTFHKKAVKNHRIKYDMFKTKTGRLSTTKDSFPILTFPKELRSVLRPNNDCFVELDYNAAELRVLLGLSGHKQPEEDLHEWNINNIFKEELTREEAKQKIFAWLYNPNMRHAAEDTYDRDFVRDKYWCKKSLTVKNIYDRIMHADEHHALNYMIQSTSNDIILEKMCEIHRILSGKNSSICFSMHDSIVLDLDARDMKLLDETYHAFSNTPLGKFKTSLKIGKNYGQMRSVS